MRNPHTHQSTESTMLRAHLCASPETYFARVFLENTSIYSVSVLSNCYDPCVSLQISNIKLESIHKEGEVKHNPHLIEKESIIMDAL